MRILWINHRDPKHPEAGGAEVHIREVGRRLAKMGHEVTLIAERFKGSPAREEIDGIDVRRVGNKYTIHLAAPMIVKKLSKDYDIIIDDIAHGVPWWSALATSKPVLGIVHHVHQVVASIELPFPLDIAVKMAEKTIRYAYRKLIAVSEATRNDLENLIGFPKDRVKVIYNGVDHSRYSPGGRRFEEPTILWLGRIKKYKNLDLLLLAFNKVKREVANARLVIAGSGDYERNVRELANKLGLRDVIFTGKIREEEKLELLRRSWVLATTSTIEGWGISILEAAACATPAVGFDAGAVREAIIDGKTGFLVRFGDAEGLAEKIYLILTDDRLRDELSRGALEYSYNFDWDKTASQTLEIMEEMAR